MNIKFYFALFCILLASSLGDVEIVQLTGSLPIWIPYLKLLILFGIFIFTKLTNNYRQLSNYLLILVVFIASQILSNVVSKTTFWTSLFSSNAFNVNIGGNILLKLVSVVPVWIALMIILKSPNKFYVVKGDLSVMADKIGWLGIDDKQINWRNLSLISAVLIAFGTIVSTMFTVVGLVSFDMKLLLSLPIIILFALINSLFEGILYRSTILGTLQNILPKYQVVIVSALLFGIGHYYGAPGGIIGVCMSGALGWYLARSMYETKGFLSSWIIHFAQDMAIFSLLWLVRN